MIERDFVNRKKKEFQIQEYIKNSLRGAGVSDSKIQRTPLGEKIVITASRPGLIIGGGGSNIKKLTAELKRKFDLDNPQIEINEIKNQGLVAAIVAERIAYSLERFGSARFKGIGHKTMENVVNAGALGVEIIISGKIPSTRARNWRFYQGYLKKCGDIAVHGVKHAQTSALLKSGIIGIKVSIMPPDIVLPDHVEILEEPEQVVEEISAEKVKDVKKDKKKSTRKTSAVKKKKETKETSETKVEIVESKEVPVAEESKSSETETMVENEEVIKESLLEKAEHAVEHLAHEVKEEIKHVVEGVGKVVDKVEVALHLKHEDKPENVVENKPEEKSESTPENKPGNKPENKEESQ